MSQNVTFLGVTYTLPDTGDLAWGDSLTAFLVALANNSASGITLSAVGSSPNANGATIGGTTLILQPSDATHPGVNTILAQTYAGVKTFSSSPVLSTATHIRATQASGQSLTSNANTVIVFDTETYDTQSEYNPSTGVFQPNETGYYAIKASVVLASDTPQVGDEIFIAIFVRGASAALGRIAYAEVATPQSLNTNISTVLQLAHTDTVDIRVTQKSGAGTARTLIAAAADNYLTIDRLF